MTTTTYPDDLLYTQDHEWAREVFGSVESVKAVSDLFAPVSGRIVKVNAALVNSPETVNEDPYSRGWMIQVAPTSTDDLKQLMDADAYRSTFTKRDSNAAMAVALPETPKRRSDATELDGSSASTKCRSSMRPVSSQPLR